MRRRERDISSRESKSRVSSSRGGKRSVSRESSIGRMDYKKDLRESENKFGKSATVLETSENEQ